MGSPRYCLFLLSVQCALSLAPCLSAQRLLTVSGSGGRVNIFNNDLAIFEAGEPRKDLPCTVTPRKPVLGFDLKFHAGYEVDIPMSELSGQENMLTLVFRVTPDGQTGETKYFTQRIRVPSIEEDAKGSAYLQGMFDLGEGKYKVEWLMRDKNERVCSDFWDMEATLTAKDKNIALATAPNAIQAAEFEQFKDEAPVLRNPDNNLNVKVLLNFAPHTSHSATMQPLDTSALVSILRTIARDPRIGRFSIVAFNLQEQKIVYRQDDADKINFPALGEALNSIHLGVVDLKRLSQKNGETDFLSDLIKKETGDCKADALVFAGPKAMLEANVSSDTLRQVGEVSYPVFYMNYNPNPQQTPWRDTISHAVKQLKGQEFTIARPRDLWFAVSEMVSRVVKLRQTKISSTSPAE